MNCTLTERITIQTFSKIKNPETGMVEPTWVNYYSCWAMLKEVSGKEFQAKGGDFTKIITSFTVRYCKKVAELVKDKKSSRKYRVVHRGVEYNILHTYDVQNNHTFIDLECDLIV